MKLTKEQVKTLKATELTHNEADALMSVGIAMYPLATDINYPHVDPIKPSGEPIADDPRMRTDHLKLLDNFPDTLDVSIKDHYGISVLCAERDTEDSSISVLIMSTRKFN